MSSATLFFLLTTNELSFVTRTLANTNLHGHSSLSYSINFIVVYAEWLSVQCVSIGQCDVFNVQAVVIELLSHNTVTVVVAVVYLFLWLYYKACTHKIQGEIYVFMGFCEKYIVMRCFWCWFLCKLLCVVVSGHVLRSF